ncbi:aquaporin-8a.1 isoform X2 [Lampris incognitus]|uniref:aquaporin-8a.1 isoform X2 n=1 Tax=Lampris incognitus TaxID=2546036 RepID=UPI0024B5EF5A|nr:aquaporin-8a.1 isoform X2 [Lampris incognitus]
MSVTESKSEVFTIAAGPDTGEAHAEKGDLRKLKKRRAAVFEQYVQPCAAELLGSCLFVFVGCASVMGSAGLEGSVQPAVAHGLALAALISAFGEISGGHLNPAVSLSVYLCGGMELGLLGPYVLAQMSGGMIGASLAKAVYPKPQFILSSGGAFTAVRSSHALGGATVAEVMMTLFLSTVVCMAAVNSRTRSKLAPFCIGLTVTAGILARLLFGDQKTRVVLK